MFQNYYSCKLLFFIVIMNYFIMIFSLWFILNKFSFQFKLGDYIIWQLIIDFKFVNTNYLFQEV